MACCRRVATVDCCDFSIFRRASRSITWALASFCTGGSPSVSASIPLLERDNGREINELTFKSFSFDTERALRLNGIKIYKLSTARRWTMERRSALGVGGAEHFQ